MKTQLEGGIYAAVATPLNEDLSCNTEELTRHSLDLLHRGCAGIVLFGTTGEGPSFSTRERIAAFNDVLKRSLDPKKTILANGSSSIDDTVMLAEAALKQGCHTLLVAPPCFYKRVEEEGVINYYREVIRRVHRPDLHIILYHIPQYSGVAITIKIIDVLRKEFPDTIIGLKESEGNFVFTKTIIDSFPGFQLFVGHETQILEAVAYGAAGSICGLANLYPELLLALYNQEKSRLDELTACSKELRGHSFIASLKAALQQRYGANWRLVRPPLVILQ